VIETALAFSGSNLGNDYYIDRDARGQNVEVWYGSQRSGLPTVTFPDRLP
jgi:hypothetical protein